MDPSPNQSAARVTRFSLNNTVPMNLLFFALLAIGVFVAGKMPVDVYPDVSLDEASVETLWLGASATDVERMVTDRIESKIQGIRGVDRIISDSKPDLSRIRVKFDGSLSSLEHDAALRQLRAAVDQVADLPEDADKPIVTKLSVAEVFFLLWVVVEDVDGVGEDVLYRVAHQLKPALRDLPGVAKVDDKFTRDREIHILVSREALRKHGLTLQDLSTLLQQYNVNLPSGSISQANDQVIVRAAGGVTDPDQLGAIVVLKNPRGGHVYLRDVAEIRPAFEKKTLFPRYNLNDCVAMGIAKTDRADSRAVAAAVRKELEEFEKRLPSGVALRVADDASDIIKSRLHVLGSNLVWGVGLVFLVLWVVIGARNAVLAIVGIPFSFVCALIFMNLLGLTINAVSLIGLVLCTGMIVDDAIVVLESVYSEVQRRSDAKGVALNTAELRTAVVTGASEVLWPVISSSATTIAAFLPLLIMTGMTGEFFSIIPKTVAVVLVASLFECLLILPVHYVDLGARMNKSGRTAGDREASSGALSLSARLYDGTLKVMIRHRYVSLLPLFCLGGLAAAAIPFVKVELFPSDFQHCLIDIRTPDESSIERTAKLIEPIERIALSLGKEKVPGVLSWIGSLITEENDVKLRQNVAQIHVQLAGTSELGADSTVVAAELRARAQAYLDAHPDTAIESIRVWAPRSGPPVGKPVSIRIECPDFKTSLAMAELYMTRLKSIDGVHGIRHDLEFGQQQINIHLDEARASVHGLTFMNLAAALRTANDGHIVSTYKDNATGEDRNVRLMLAQHDRRNLRDLLDIDVRTGEGYVTRVKDISTIDVSQGYAGIPHFNGRRSVTVTAEVDTGVTTARAVNETIVAAFAERIVSASNLRVVYGGENAETTASFTSLRDAYMIAIIVIYMILATQFRSYLQPFTIMATVPFACIGVVGGLLIGDYPFTIMTFIAIVGMSGVVVNDSILLVDCINQQRAILDDPFKALRVAALRRARPVLMTTVTTVVGLAPLALGLGGRSKIWSPFASSFAWGLAFATIVTMLYIPVVYQISQDVAGLFVRTFRPSRENNDAVVAAT